MKKLLILTTLCLFGVLSAMGQSKSTYPFVERDSTLYLDVHRPAVARADKEKILEASHHYLQQPPINFSEVFGDGHAAKFMLERMLESF